MGLLVFAGNTQGVLARQAAQVKHETEATHTSGGPDEGIKVHGHWVIDVRNPDGSFVSHTEFENALVPSEASPFLARVLAGKASVGTWGIRLAASSPANDPCFINTPTPCVLTEVVARVIGNGLQLDGNTTVQASNANIGAVATLFTQCGLTLDPVTSCPNRLSLGTFSSRTLSSPVSVAPGQIVQVTVTITFS